MAMSYKRNVFKWEKADLEELVNKGVLTRNSEITEHVALHPYWLGDPLKGVCEDFDKAISTWRQRLEGYLVAYEDVRIAKNKPSFIHIDQPWIHIDVQATFYIYKPAQGQVVEAVVRRIGLTAAVCLVLNCFPLTVDPTSPGELKSWYPGIVLEVEITSFEIRRKSPFLRATCLRVLDSVNPPDDGGYGYYGYEYTAVKRDIQPAALNISVPKSKKKKKNTIIKFDD